MYVRQSTLAQVMEHGESTERQYALRERALALGWTEGTIEVIDEDLGRSGSTTDGRTGFARMIDGIARGEFGAIFAIEVSRLARSSLDWQRLLSLCAVAEVVVGDEQAVYDPANGDDKLLLDIKGTMSEAELRWLGLRLHGALQSKARRGELRLTPPTRYVWGGERFELDPDESVQAAVRLVFERFRVEPSAYAVARWANEQRIEIPARRNQRGGSELVWNDATPRRITEILKNPAYTGTYVYGRRPTRKVLIDGEIRQRRAAGRDPEQWSVRIDGAHPAYIDREEYSRNLQKLEDNVSRPDTPGAPRNGGALLAGLLLCGECGYRLTTSYATGGLHYYSCSGRPPLGRPCKTYPGRALDRAVEELFLDTMVPDELDLSLAVERDVDARAQALEHQWKLRQERVEYEARRAERRYKAVDPDNRVVARTLEGEWEQCLRALEQVRNDYERARREHHVVLTEGDRAAIRALARDLPAVWNSPTTTVVEKKAMFRLVIEVVSLRAVEVPDRETVADVAWKSGAVTTLHVPRPTNAALLRTDDATVTRLRELAVEALHDRDIAGVLDAEGFRTATGLRWTVIAVRNIRKSYGIERRAPSLPTARPLPDRRDDESWSVRGAAGHFGVTVDVVRRWLRKGLVKTSRERTRGPLWLHIDEADEHRIRELAAISRRRARRKAARATDPTES